jgi:hypothetical protein
VWSKCWITRRSVAEAHQGLFILAVGVSDEYFVKGLHAVLGLKEYCFAFDDREPFTHDIGG